MSYQVLARKWRPRNFIEMVGQEHVLRALVNALDNNRLHHAFLFTGTRGVGKTTIARILAKSLNCETGVTSKPCGQCSACNEIDEGRFVDLIEVDAASRTKVEDTRELLENVQYAPTRGRYKVYLIDEVHMLSTHSFNALLKTLEEPLPHVKFLLATTDPQKLPVTILSRCLQFNLKRLPVDVIGSHLTHVLGKENVESDASALLLIARSADGSMRDALSLLDQAIAYGGGKVMETDVRAMLGTIDQSHVVALLEALNQKNANALLEITHEIEQQAYDFFGVLTELASTLHHIALMQMVPAAQNTRFDNEERLLTLADTFTPEEIQLFYQIAVIGRRDLPLAPDSRSGFEMTLLRMLAFRPVDENSSGNRTTKPRATSAATIKTPVSSVSKSTVEVESRLERKPVHEQSNIHWNTTVNELNLTGLTRQLAIHCIVKEHNEDLIHLELDTAYSQLLTDKQKELLHEALQSHLNHPIRLNITTGVITNAETPAQLQQQQQNERLQAAELAIKSDRNVQSLLETFNARIEPNSIQPTE